jgi:hypothetical protein
MKALFHEKGTNTTERNAELEALHMSGKKVWIDQHGREIVMDLTPDELKARTKKADTVGALAAIAKEKTNALPAGVQYCSSSELGIFLPHKRNGFLRYQHNKAGAEASQPGLTKISEFTTRGGDIARNYVSFAKAGLNVEDLDIALLAQHTLVPEIHRARAQRKYPDNFRIAGEKGVPLVKQPRLPSPGDKITGTYLGGKPSVAELMNEGLLTKPPGIHV